MDVLECSNWIVCLSQVPNIEAWILVVIVGNHELGGQIRVPHHASSFGLELIFILRRIIEVLLRLR